MDSQKHKFAELLHHRSFLFTFQINEGLNLSLTTHIYFLRC